MSQAVSIRRMRVSGCLAELIQSIQSWRAIGVMSAHNACASGAAEPTVADPAGGAAKPAASSPTKSETAPAPVAAPKASAGNGKACACP